MRLVVTIVISLVLFASCENSTKQFELIDSSYTNLVFSNEVFGEDDIDILKNYFYYNGAGVAVADFDNDGLEDIFMTGNHVPSRLYKNKGNLEFEDITEQAGLMSDTWSTGVTFADVNADGLKDIYVCTVGKNEGNLFYLNKGVNENGIPIFEEKAGSYGIDTKNISVQAAFFDYDKDDDLDLIVAVNSQVMNYRNAVHEDSSTPISERTSEILFKNNDDGTFSNVSEEAKITREGSSLGLAINDLNNDGWPDIYVSNDFISSDLLYINNQDGTFTNRTNDYLRHTTFHGMGVDISDIDQDGLMDITVMDMLPETDQRRKLMLAPINYDLHEKRLNEGSYNPQFVRNTLQLNQGSDSNGQLHFSELGFVSGMYATDWSWAPLWADYDNDGKKDLFITNGYPRDITDLDHINGLRQNSFVGSNQSNKAQRIKSQNEVRAIVESNYLFKGLDGIEIEDKSKQVGITTPSISHGSAFSDLDNDGDLELLTNNFRQEMFLLKNNSNENDETGNNNFLKIKLLYKNKNLDALGAKVKLYQGSHIHNYFHSYVRGYMSSMGDVIHFGLGEASKVDSIVITWPDLKLQTITDVKANQVLEISYTDKAAPQKESKDENFIFKNDTDSLNLVYEHTENKFIDFKNEPLFLKMYSREGPALAIGDIDNNGFDDVFLGGANQRNGQFFLQDVDGFSRREIIKDSIYEDMGALFFDVDNDNDQDLYVVSGGSEFGPDSEYYQDRLYTNDGNSNFSRSLNLPKISASGGPVKGADYDKDGDIDLFVGGKIKMGDYPIAPRSYLLKNTKGNLEDHTPEHLKFPGMVSDALWTDFNNDGWIDLILVGEWMEITFYKNEEGKLLPHSPNLPNSSGWWNSIAAGDFDKDGDTDYIIGNLGTNSYLKASSQEPVRLYAGDFDKNGKVDPILSYYTENSEGKKEEYVLHNRDAMAGQIVGFQKRFRDYLSYANAPFKQVLTKKETKDANILDARCFTSSYIENLGDGKFAMTPLPWQCQTAPISGMIVKDVNADGNLDAVLIGNQHATEPIFGSYDASLGMCLLGNGKGELKPTRADESGLYLRGNQKSLVDLMIGNQSFLLAGINSGNIEALTYETKGFSKNIRLRPLDCYAKIEWADGSKSKKEFYYGHSYLSQGAREFSITNDMKEVIIVDALGEQRKIEQ